MSRPFNIAARRVREIMSLVIVRHGRLPDTDDVDIYLMAVAHHLPHHDRAWQLDNWCRRLGLVIPDSEIDRIVTEVEARPRKWKADTLARELRTTYDERTKAGISTIDCIERCSMTAAGATCDNMPAKGLKNLCNTLH
jgi:hypothetical protein